MTVAVFGDSIAWGMVDPLGGGWVNRSKRLLEKQFSDLDFYNLSVPGDTTADVLRRFEVESKSREPEVIIFAIGINDTVISTVGQRAKVAESTFLLHLQKLYRLASLFSRQVFFVGLTRVDEKRSQPMRLDPSITYQNRRIERFDQLLRNFAETQSALYVPVAEVLKPSDLIDGLHPNTQGHQKLFRQLRQQLLPAVIAALQK